MRPTLVFLVVAAPLAAQPVDFNRDVRPILSNKCFACHGPDEKERKADLRLDTRDGALADLDGHQAVVPGKPAASELVARVTSDKAAKKMPPAKTGKTLSAAEIDVLKRWVQEGAPYAKHWAYVPPVRPTPPDVRDPRTVIRNPIDQFLAARLQKEGLAFLP